ncbi:S8 family serine peptidase [Chloroflexota bacterium]
MKIARIFIVITVICLVFNFSAVVFASSPDGGESAELAPAEILVKFKPNIGPSDMAEIHHQCGGHVKETIPALGVQVILIPRGRVLEKVRAYSAKHAVSYAEPNYLCQVIGSPDDNYFNNQWGMNKVESPQAWDITKGSSDINIAILDTGVDMDHPDLAGKITANINFSSSSTVDDLYGHGTHVAGIAAASTNNGIGVAGLGYDSTIMNVKVLGDTGSGYYSWVANGIIWAADNGAEVINLSLGGSSYSLTLENAVKYAWSKGAVVVAAAGNNGSSSPFYPAYYTNCIAVAATDTNDNLASWSNRGDWVDVAAPGTSIYSTLKNNSYGYKSGTSMASPHTAGLAALVHTVTIDSNGNGQLNDEVRSKIEASCDDVGLIGIGNGRINAYRAVISSPLPTGTITGKVTDAIDGSPIEGATVIDGRTVAVTDANGIYTLSDIPTGDYTVTASKEGYETAPRDVTVVSGQTTIASFTLLRISSPTKPMWINSITFRGKGKNLCFDVVVVDGNAVVAGARIAVELIWNESRIWISDETTDDSGIAKFMVRRAPAGNYVATVTSLSASGYTWDTNHGIISASYTLDRSGGKPDKNKSK